VGVPGVRHGIAVDPKVFLAAALIVTLELKAKAVEALPRAQGKLDQGAAG
jgi:hypothetical protein